MYTIEQSKKIIEGKFEEIKAHLERLDNESMIEVANKMRQSLAQHSTK